MLNSELLINKGFKLNTYPQGRFYEFKTTDDTLIMKILGKDYYGDEETLIFQLKEDFSNKLLCVDSNVWELNNNEFIDYLSRF